MMSRFDTGKLEPGLIIFSVMIVVVIAAWLLSEDNPSSHYPKDRDEVDSIYWRDTRPPGPNYNYWLPSEEDTSWIAKTGDIIWC